MPTWCQAIIWYNIYYKFFDHKCSVTEILSVMSNKGLQEEHVGDM